MTDTTDYAADFIPTRHGADIHGARQMLGILTRILPDAKPSDERWQAMGQALMQGDESMDELLQWMTGKGMKTTRPQFEQAITAGIDSLKRPPAVLRRFFEQVEQPPEWLDQNQIDLACQLHQRAGMASVYVGRDVALLGGYQASAFNKTLILTGALQKGPTRRFAETLQWALDITSDEGLRPGGCGYQSTLRVRLIHALVRRHVQQMPEWRMAEWGLPINQTDMAATLLGAVFVPMVGAQLMGMPMTRNEREALAHHARYTGWLIGVDEAWLPRSYREALILLYQFLLSLSNPDETSPQMAMPLADEPLSRPYPNLSWLRGRLNRSRHLSISKAFLGKQSMRNLGLPENSLPWYPALAVPANLLRHSSSWLLPGGKTRQAKRGRAAQQAFLDTMTGKQAAQIGEAASGILNSKA